MPASLILNPYSNRWKAGEMLPMVEAVLRQAGIEFTTHLTERHGHGIELARSAAQAGSLPLIAAGGDGILSEVVNGLMQACDLNALPAGPVGILPLGTANDLADMLGIPHDLPAAVGVIAAGRTRVIDLGRVNGRYFDNNSGVGFEPEVTAENERLVKLKGVMRYMIAALITIMRRPTWQARLEWDDGAYEGSISLVSVGNSARTGGAFRMTPQAELDDGMLDFVFSQALGRLRMFQFFPKTQKGTHIHEPEVYMYRTRRLKIQLSPPSLVQADGEIMAGRASEVLYDMLPGALRVFVL